MILNFFKNQSLLRYAYICSTIETGQKKKENNNKYPIELKQQRIFIKLAKLKQDQHVISHGPLTVLYPSQCLLLVQFQ